MLTSDDLNKLDFKPSGVSFSVSFGERNIGYHYGQDSGGGQCNKPGVYLFLDFDEAASQKAKVLYVGKAGKGVRRRMRQHEAGFKRSKEKGIYSTAIERLFTYANERNGDKLTVAVWFRESQISSVGDVLGLGPIKLDSEELENRLKGREVSRFSNEEEALIGLFHRAAGTYLMNSSIPAFFDENSQQGDEKTDDLSATINKIIQKCDGHGHCNKLKTELENRSADWDERDREAFALAIESVGEDPTYRDRVPKIIDAYTKGPFRGQPLLVFGKLPKGNERFSPNTNNLYFSLDGRYMVKYPWDDEQIEITFLPELLDF